MASFLYKTDPQDPCLCCKEKICPDKGCSTYGNNYTCFASEEVDLDIMGCAPLDMNGISLCNDGIFSQNPCRCCHYKKQCNDTGCSSQNKGYQCLNELDAAEHPIPCMKHDVNLCASSKGWYDIKHFCTSGDHFEFCPIIDETKQFLPFNFCNVIFPRFTL